MRTTSTRVPPRPARKLAGNADYLPSSDSETFTINQAATTTAATCSAGPFTYTGAAIKPCTATVTGPGLNQAVAVTYADNVNAGTATASASYAGSTNHLPSSAATTFTIAKAATTTKVTCSAGPFPFTGSPIEPCTATSDRAGARPALAVTYAGNVNAGTATASASDAGSANLLPSSDSETFIIGEAAAMLWLYIRARTPPEISLGPLAAPRAALAPRERCRVLRQSSRCRFPPASLIPSLLRRM